MPRVKVPEEAVWKEFELETKLIVPPVLKLKIKPTFRKDLIKNLFRSVEVRKKEEPSTKEVLDSFNDMAEFSKTLVLDWDLVNEDDQPIPCNEETKNKWLEPLLWEAVRNQEGEETGLNWLWFSIIKFASDLSNFTKN